MHMQDDFCAKLLVAYRMRLKTLNLDWNRDFLPELEDILYVNLLIYLGKR